MKDCEAFRQLLIARLDDELSDAQNDALREHLELCEDCRAWQQLPDTLARELATPVEAPEGFTGRVMAALPGKGRKAKVVAFPRRWAGLAAAVVIVAGLGLAGSRVGISRADKAAAPMAAVLAEEAPAEFRLGGAVEPAAAPREAAMDMAAQAVTQEAPEREEAAEVPAAGESGSAYAAYDEENSVSSLMAAPVAAEPAENSAVLSEEALCLAAAAYVREHAAALTGADASVFTALEGPVLEWLAEPPEDYLPCAGDYAPRGACCRVAFATSQEELGDVVLLLDESGTVFGILPRG